MTDIDIDAKDFIIDEHGISAPKATISMQQSQGDVPNLPSYETLLAACQDLHAKFEAVMAEKNAAMQMLWAALAANNGQLQFPLERANEPVGSVKWDHDGTTVRLMAILPNPEALENKAYIP